MQHQFNIFIAQKYGVDEAIMVHNIYYWVFKNEANNKNYHDGHYWTYNTLNALTQLFPYWTRRQIERILINAEQKGILMKGNFNKHGYDRTGWYTTTQNVKCYYANGEIQITERGNGNHQTVTTIPNSKTDSKEQIENTDVLLRDFDKFWSLYDKKTDKQKCMKKWRLLKQEVKDKILLHVPKYVISQPDVQFRKNPLTYLTNESWNDEYLKNSNQPQSLILKY